MPKSPFMIAGYSIGLQNDVAPWLLPDNAFFILEDAYVWRSRLIRREGNQKLGIMVHDASDTYVGEVTNADTTWDNTGSPLSNLPVSPKSVTVTINLYTFTDDGDGNMTGSGTGTIDYETGVISLTFTAIGAGGPYDVVVDYEYYPYLPVMGLRSFETSSVNKEELIAFDTEAANKWNYNTAAFNDISFYYGTTTPVAWTGGNADFFWSCNYQGAMFATNNTGGYYTNPVAGSGTGDGIRYYFEISPNLGWVNFMPLITATDALKGALIIVPYKDRLVCLNTIEGPTAQANKFNRFAQRARWCQNGTCFYDATAIPTNQTADANSWRDDINGRGGYIDAPTQEAIVGAGFVRDTLIVKFERSTWQLRYTSNQALPFVWQRVDAELGSDATFSEVIFDQGLLGVGSRGVITSNGNSSQRIDIPIPDTVFSFNADGSNFERVYGIRDFYKQIVYWTYVSEDNLQNWPDKLLIYNYRDNTWAIFNDSYTCFGYFQQNNVYVSGTGYFWDTYEVNWDEADIDWDGSGGGGTVANNYFPDIAAGTNNGYVMLLNKATVNGPQIRITNITQAQQGVVTTVTDHNLFTGQFVKISGVEGMTEINGLNSEVELLTSTTFRLLDIDTSGFSAYTIAGEVTRINGMSAITKRFNPYVSQGAGVDMSYADVYVDTVQDGEISINVFNSGNTNIPVNSNLWQTAISLSDVNPNYPQESFWTRFNCRTVGQFVQFQFYFTKEQLLDDDINSTPFILNGMTLWFEPRTRIV